VSRGSGTDDEPAVTGDRAPAPERQAKDAADEPRLAMRQNTYRYRQDLDWNDAAAPVSTAAPALERDAPAIEHELATTFEMPSLASSSEAVHTHELPSLATSAVTHTDDVPSLASFPALDAPAIAASTTEPSPAAPVRRPAFAVVDAAHARTQPLRGAHVAPKASISSTAVRPHQVVDRDRELERQEHLATVGRMKRLMPLATALWLGFFFVDWVLATFVVPSPLLPYLGLRLVGVVPILISWRRLAREPTPSPRLLAALDLMMTTSSATILSAMCLLSGGLTSPYATYIAMVIAGRAASTPDHWRTGIVRLGVPALASPVVLALALPFSTRLQQQLLDAGARGTYFFYLMLIGGAWGLLVIASHNAWTLRRQVFRSRSIGRYRLERRIGEGGMGEVWVAWDEQLRRDVALKILRPEAGTQAAAVARFEREIMATAALSHPNTVRIFDHGVTDDGLWYYAMELLSGVDLYELVASDGPLSPGRAIHLARQAAGALAEAHRRGIVHRDLKPENVFVAELGGEPDFVKVLDFGIVRMTQSDEVRLTGTGWVAGTPAYVSPEVAAGGDAGPPADVYGLGGVLYFALTGTPPFDAESSVALLRLHVSAVPEPPSKRRGRPLPPGLEETILRCLAKRPEDRFADAGELARALDTCAASGTTDVPEDDEVLVVPRLTPVRFPEA
jgi:hypothetical protein